MRSAIIFWYYIILALIVTVSLIFGDFSQITSTVRLILVLALVLLVANPLINFWIHQGGEKRLRQVMGDPNADLELKVERMEEQISDLREENEKLDKTDKAKSEFVAMTAHQLRTPLSAIRWTFNMVMNGDLGPVTPDQRSFLQKGSESAEKVITVINDWLNLDYFEANKGRYQFRSSDIVEIIDNVVFEFTQKIQDKNLNLIFQKPQEKLPEIMVDPVKFSMIIENLIDNSIKYTPFGGQIMISINDEKLRSSEQSVEIVVMDSGIGIPRPEQDRIFQQFFRSTNAVQSSPRGSGLGLYIVKQLVEGHGGRVWFSSDEGKGTKFFLSIPVKQKGV